MWLRIVTYMILVAIGTLFTYFLWNWLMPDIFGLKEITVLQAVGLNMLSYCFFKNSVTSSSKS